MKGIIDVVWDTSERLLRLLALLQRRRDWSALQLAEELAVTARTVRRDMSRLRTLGYPIATVHGAGGGYELEPGAALPPLMFDTPEAVATLLALREAAAIGHSTTPSALSALDKLSRVMPPRLRPVVEALSTHASTLGLASMIGALAVPVDLETLVVLARGCRERKQVTCTYRGASGHTSVRRIEPLHLVHAMGRWYLVAYCLDAASWRTFRVDRVTELAMTKIPSYPRHPPAADLHAYVTARIGAGIQRVTATVHVHALRPTLEQWIHPAWGTIREETTDGCIVEVGADSYAAIARWLLLMNVDVTVVRPQALRTAFAELAVTATNIADDESAAG
jgi:predicted DNA-binding transcriptional regulator YafY